MCDIFSWLCTFSTEIKWHDFGFFCFDIDFTISFSLIFCCFVQIALDAPSGDRWHKYCQSGIDDCGQIKEVPWGRSGRENKSARPLVVPIISSQELSDWLDFRGNFPNAKKSWRSQNIRKLRSTFEIMTKLLLKEKLYICQSKWEPTKNITSSGTFCQRIQKYGWSSKIHGV